MKYSNNVVMAAIHQPQYSDVGPRPGESKKKEIYKYLAPWTVYGMNWSVRPDKRFRLAIGSFIEDYKNKVRCVKGSRGRVKKKKGGGGGVAIS